jgi:hypothetical protein
MSIHPHWARCSAAVVATLAIAAATAPAALATTHDYCNWDGSTCANAANTVYFALGDNLLTNNFADLVFSPTAPTIFCGAHQGGAQYAGYASGNPACDHTYGGTLALKADEFVDIAATTHGTITY